MPGKCDVLITGTGAFAERLVFDLAITAEVPITVAVAGRNRERMDWLVRAGNGRAALMARPVTVAAAPVVWDSPETIAGTLADFEPGVVVHAATVQSPKDVRGADDPWTRLLRKAGGFGATGLLQMLLAGRCAQAMIVAGNDGAFVNASYPDLVNPVLAAKGLPVSCGLGNVEIVAALLAGDLGIREAGALKVLAHHHNLSDMRAPPDARDAPPRVWVRGEEITDVYRRFAHLHLPDDPLDGIAGTTGVNVVTALAGHRDHVGHAPGPHGLPGGYPIAIRNRALSLDLPDGLTAADAVAWNRQFGAHEGMTLGEDGRVSYSARARAAFAAVSASLAEGFHVDDIEAAAAEMLDVRRRLAG